jgi:hypothetical protein
MSIKLRPFRQVDYVRIEIHRGCVAGSNLGGIRSRFALYVSMCSLEATCNP